MHETGFDTALELRSELDDDQGDGDTDVDLEVVATDTFESLPESDDSDGVEATDREAYEVTEDAETTYAFAECRGCNRTVSGLSTTEKLPHAPDCPVVPERRASR